MADWTELIHFTTAIFVIANPIGATPIFLSMTPGQSEVSKRRTARSAALTVGTVLTITILCGEALLHAFGIELAAFQVGGGILFLLMAVSMLHAQTSRIQHTKDEADEARERESVGVVPLGIPLLAGPGAMSTAIVFAHHAPGWGSRVLLVLICWVLAGSVWLALSLADVIGRILGRTGINILNRLMGLMLAAIAVQFVIGGTMQLIHSRPFRSPVEPALLDSRADLECRWITAMFQIVMATS